MSLPQDSPALGAAAAVADTQAEGGANECRVDGGATVAASSQAPLQATTATSTSTTSTSTTTTTSASTTTTTSSSSSSVVQLPQKRYYRQRAHANPLADHVFQYPVTPAAMDWSQCFETGEGGPAPVVRFLDVGCGYGGLLVELAPMFPDKHMLGLEIRIKVSDYVRDRILALRSQHPGQYQNIGVLRTNAMKYLPNFFHKGQLEKMFFLYPDPHFKGKKHKWRIITPTLLSEYAFFLGVGGLLYTITDVVELHEWMVAHLAAHPLFARLSDDEMAADPVVEKLYCSTEEGKKVYRNKERGKNHGDGDVRAAVFRRIAGPRHAGQGAG